MKVKELQKLQRGAAVRAVQRVERSDSTGDRVFAEPGELGEVVEPSRRGWQWPTVRFERGATIVFEDEVEVAT